MNECLNRFPISWYETYATLTDEEFGERLGLTSHQFAARLRKDIQLNLAFNADLQKFLGTIDY